MGSPKERGHKLRACLPLLGHSKSKKLCMLTRVPSPVNPLYVGLSCGFKMEREQKNHEVFHFPTDLFGIELGAFFSNQDYFLWCHLKFSVRILLRAHSLALSFIKYILTDCLFCAWCQRTMGSQYSTWKPCTFSHIPIYVLLNDYTHFFGFSKKPILKNILIFPCKHNTTWQQNSHPHIALSLPICAQVTCLACLYRCKRKENVKLNREERENL